MAPATPSTSASASTSSNKSTEAVLLGSDSQDKKVSTRCCRLRLFQTICSSAAGILAGRTSAPTVIATLCKDISNSSLGWTWQKNMFLTVDSGNRTLEALRVFWPWLSCDNASSASVTYPMPPIPIRPKTLFWLQHSSSRMVSSAERISARPVKRPAACFRGPPTYHFSFEGKG